MMSKLGTQVHSCHTCMGAFGGGSEKGMHLVGTAPCIEGLAAKSPKQLCGSNAPEIVRKKIRADGSVSVSGGKDLKASQAYPPNFGLKVAECFHKYITTEPVYTPVLAATPFTEDDCAAMLVCLPMPLGV